MSDSFEHFQQQMSGMFDSFTLFRQDDEKPLYKTADMTEATSPSYMYDPSTSFASWLSSQDFDNGHVVVPSPPNSPHLLGDKDDDDTSICEELLYNNGTSPEEKYDGSKPFVEWLSSRDADNFVLTPSSPRKRVAQFEGLMFQSAYEHQVEGGNKKDMSLEHKSACNEQNDAVPTTVLENICYGNDFARMISQTCGCTIIMQLNDLLDTRHCDGDVQGQNNDDHHNEICVNEGEDVEVPFDEEIHHSEHDSSGEETSTTTERAEMEEIEMEDICLDDSFEIQHNSYDEESCKSEMEKEEGIQVDEMNVHVVTPENMPDTELNDGEESLYAPEREEKEGEEEQHFPMDETNALAVTPMKLFEKQLEPRKKLSQMLLDTSIFQIQPNNNAWWSGCSVDGDDINTVDLESLDDTLNDHDEIFRKPSAPPSLSEEVHLLGASFATFSTSSDHGSIFEKVLYQEDTTKPIAYDVDVRPLKKVAETRASFLDRTQANPHREDNHSRRSSISRKEMEPKGRTQDNSRREDNLSRCSSISSKEMEPKGGKENTIIVMSVRGRRGKDKYARHARKQRLSSKAARLIPGP